MYHNLENIKRLNLNLLYFYVILWTCIIYYLLLSKNATYNFMFNKNKNIYIILNALLKFIYTYLKFLFMIWFFRWILSKKYCILTYKKNLECKTNNFLMVEHCFSMRQCCPIIFFLNACYSIILFPPICLKMWC